ncbi:calcium homeostasis modulator protein 5 isoform X2 [Canis lupus familiaris]|uniref:calcium homeostasis modulator protein 5 isoform X2 n=1 Tax=Canis lupus familiaris TaxID=9615 RepID=UPI000DC68FF4|nr:calcium homeostasis modulator protein 5 isoform X2 [Canis lupus familiaris]XP_038395847.1 calcium homeostasis modulator protein 5 isoform X2 [Canis lupus familiaris]XP_038510640.1 calcium homeostasis modulator protein 5 isoform X2 [Canis lupus familiaris]XP_048970701.1 calcium homeostasis modulator protein 5 isoform X2 [Canis lupus dingo]
MDAFQGILKFFLNQKTVIGYSFMALLTVGSERLFSLVAFKCPCSKENVAYGLVFLVAPAWVLLILGFFLNSRSWRLFTGCCVNPRKIFPKGHSCRFFHVLGQITLSSLVAPMMWLSVALLNGTFYECAMSGTKSSKLLGLICKDKPRECWDELHKVSCGKTSLTAADSEELKLSLQAQSQVRKDRLLFPPRRSSKDSRSVLLPGTAEPQSCGHVVTLNENWDMTQPAHHLRKSYFGDSRMVPDLFSIFLLSARHLLRSLPI